MNSPYCFIAGTVVLTVTGKRVIESIEAGDLVWAWDETTGDVALKEVIETYENETTELVHVFVNGDEIISTPAHPFYLPDEGWTTAEYLDPGDTVVLANGDFDVIDEVYHETLAEPVTVYNFNVEDYHTYYVGEDSVLVHNKCSVNKNGVKIDVRTSNEHGLPHAHVSGGGKNTTVGLDMLPMKNHPSLTTKQLEVIKANWRKIADDIAKYFPKIHRS